MSNEQAEIKRLAKKVYDANYYAARKEHRKATAKAYRLKHQEEHRIKYRESRAAMNKRYRANHGERILRSNRKKEL